MFSKKNKKTASPIINTNNISIIGEGTEVTGDIKSKNSFRIDGKVVGEIKIEGKIFLSSNAFVEGNIYCIDAEICGEISGNIFAKGNVSIKENAIITGDINYREIEIAQGAKLECKLKQIDKPKEAKTKDIKSA